MFPAVHAAFQLFEVVHLFDFADTVGQHNRSHRVVQNRRINIFNAVVNVRIVINAQNQVNFAAQNVHHQIFVRLVKHISQIIMVVFGVIFNKLVVNGVHFGNAVFGGYHFAERGIVQKRSNPQPFALVILVGLNFHHCRRSGGRQAKQQKQGD